MEAAISEINAAEDAYHLDQVRMELDHLEAQQKKLEKEA